MIFQNKPLVQRSLNTDKKHREATTGLDRKSTFYDRTLSQEFKNHFKFIRPKESVFYDDRKVSRAKRLSLSPKFNKW